GGSWEGRSARCLWRSPFESREAVRGPCASRPLVRGLLLLDLAQTGEIELASACEVDHALLILEDVGQLRVAVAEHQRVLEQHPGEALEALVELLLAAHPCAVAPGDGGLVPGALRLGGLAASCALHQIPPYSETK